jgi:hypothetical protein
MRGGAELSFVRSLFACRLGACRIGAGGSAVRWVAAGALTLAGAGAAAQEYEFTYGAGSGLGGSVSFDATAAGTLIGDWDPTTNPGGTRTKPGLFGSFGATENVAVPVSLGASLGGSLATQSTGGLRLDLNAGAGIATVRGFEADLLGGGGAVTLPASVSLLFDPFRTRQPDAVFPGGVPLSVPVGGVSLTELRAVQTGPAGIGTLTDLGGGGFAFTVVTAVELTARFEVFGQSIELTVTPTVLPLTGTILTSGDTATLSSLAEVDVSRLVNPDAALPQFALDLPTLLPPGGSAGLLFDLVLSELGLTLDASLAVEASGVLVPGPSAGVVLACAVGVAGARRRRRGPGASTIAR